MELPAHVDHDNRIILIAGVIPPEQRMAALARAMQFLPPVYAVQGKAA